ncbi:hypothetical protein [Microvirga tunisiensis]|uniref:Uncharacterized protein n=1 Tax=Microvirga tunisiensis TaxID=2108360 RepID=A0A5N7MS72_9HYPH|nr:hypothetical protein [Microvirga tunisiensis]MPR11804.1 hypothetical protein [Microvirga tunisiensis]MPR29837.1 hypothetical protein [Microvirga tunisiensis]
MSKAIIEAILALKKRVDALEDENKALVDLNEKNISTFNENLKVIAERFEGIETKLTAISAPTVVDADGVVTEVTGALVKEFDDLKAVITGEVNTLKTWFHQHLDDHNVNGGMPKMLTGVALHEAMQSLGGMS